MKSKKITVLLSVILAGLALSSCEKKQESATEQTNVSTVEKQEKKIVASTSWTAAFAFIAGADQVQIIAPASLQHPPEYEVTVEDIQTISESDYFIYAGFERMMKTLGDSVGNTEMIKINCDNSIETVTAETLKIAEILGTQEIREKRLAEYVKVIEDGKKRVEEEGLAGVTVFCNRNQTYLARDLGLLVAQVFGPGPVTSDQIEDSDREQYPLIIDNVHNPQGGPLAEVSPDSKYIVWRNFPETVEADALKKVVESNINELFIKD